MTSKFFRACMATAVILSTRLALACPLCGDNLANDVYGKNPTQLGRGFFWSIILMVAVPFIVSAVVATRIMLARKRARRNAAACFALPGQAAVRVQPGGSIPSTPLSP